MFTNPMHACLQLALDTTYLLFNNNNKPKPNHIAMAQIQAGLGTDPDHKFIDNNLHIIICYLQKGSVVVSRVNADNIAIV